MKNLSLLIACLLILIVSKAQSDSLSGKKQKNLVASINSIDKKIIKGNVFAVNHSQVVLKTYNGSQYVSAENIRTFTLKRRNSVLRGALIGLGIGAVTGVIIGFASGNDPIMSYDNPNDPFGIGASLNNMFAMTAGQKAVAGGLFLGTTGAVVGAIIGAVAKKKFIIGGRKQKFHDLQGEIMMKLLRK